MGMPGAAWAVLPALLLLVSAFAGAEEWAKATGVEAPRVQTEAGVQPKDVMCRDGHVLAIRINQDPMCTTPETAETLLERGIILTILGETDSKAGPGAAPMTGTTADAGGQKEGGTAGIPDGQQAGGTAGIPDGQQAGGTATDAAREEPHATEPDAGMTEEQGEGADGMQRGSGGSDTSNDRHQRTEDANRVRTIPASTMSVVNFYVTDQDLNIARNAAETVSTERLRFMLNDTPIQGPRTMTETGPNTGQFYVRLELPTMIDGRPLNQDDVVHITYLDQSDYSGEPRTVTKSFALASTYAQIQLEGDGSRIGHEFTLRIYEPDANMDSREENKIPLSKLEFKSEGGNRAALSDPAFDANRSHMVETGPNTGIFEVEIKIPRQLNGKIIHIGDWYEITYIDTSTPSGTTEEIVLKGRVGG